MSVNDIKYPLLKRDPVTNGNIPVCQTCGSGMERRLFLDANWMCRKQGCEQANRNSHTLFKAEDFTAEEIERGNILAINVVEKGYSICKICGRGESELIQLCGYPRKADDAIENKPNGNT